MALKREVMPLDQAVLAVAVQGARRVHQEVLETRHPHLRLKEIMVGTVAVAHRNMAPAAAAALAQPEQQEQQLVRVPAVMAPRLLFLAVALLMLAVVAAELTTWLPVQQAGPAAVALVATDRLELLALMARPTQVAVVVAVVPIPLVLCVEMAVPAVPASSSSSTPYPYRAS